MYRNIGDEIYEVVSAIREDAEKKLYDDHDIYENECYNLGIRDVTENVIIEYVKSILSDEKLRKKLVNNVSKQIHKEYKDREKRRNDQLKKDKKLFKITGGKIPCLYGCGYVQIKTEKEVLHDFGNSFVCKDCCDKLEAEGKRSWEIFDNRNVYKMFGIE